MRESQLLQFMKDDPWQVLRDENRPSSVLGRRNAKRSAGPPPAELDDERLREAPRTQQAPWLRDATRVAASVPLPDGLRPPERLYFHPNKEQMTLFALQSREWCCGPEGTAVVAAVSAAWVQSEMKSHSEKRWPHADRAGSSNDK